MNTERKILANLAWRVYKSRQRIAERRYMIDTKHEFLFHEAVAEWVGLHNAFQQAKQIYFDNH
jgi:hypothetical protein